MSRRDDETPDDDADTPPDLRSSRRAVTQPAIESKKKLKYRQPDAERDADNFREFRRTGPMEAVPEEANDEPSRPLSGLSEEGQQIYDSLKRKLARAENRTMEVQAAVVQQPETKVKQWSRLIAEKTIALVLGGVATWLLTAYNSARSELSDQHDRILELEIRLHAIERRMPPDILQAGHPAKEP